MKFGSLSDGLHRAADATAGVMNRVPCVAQQFSDRVLRFRNEARAVADV